MDRDKGSVQAYNGIDGYKAFSGQHSAPGPSLLPGRGRGSGGVVRYPIVFLTSQLTLTSRR